MRQQNNNSRHVISLQYCSFETEYLILQEQYKVNLKSVIHFENHVQKCDICFSCAETLRWNHLRYIWISFTKSEFLPLTTSCGFYIYCKCIAIASPFQVMMDFPSIPRCILSAWLVRYGMVHRVQQNFQLLLCYIPFVPFNWECYVLDNRQLLLKHPVWNDFCYGG